MHWINLAFLHLYFLYLFNLNYVDVHDGLSLYHMNINPLRNFPLTTLQEKTNHQSCIPK